MAEVERAVLVNRIFGSTIVRVGNWDKTQYNEGQSKYAHGKEKHLVYVCDGSILCYCTDESTHKHWGYGSHQRVERATDKA